uniref:Claudin 34 n=1 Tax=Prolemur simus TaxID=1328070 RepID=A0A8C8ZUC2_PROSS
MPLTISSAECQVAGFAIATIGWILSSTSMGLVEWRVWHMNDPSFFPTGYACVGMWRVCMYRHHINISTAKFCHRYTYYDDFLPLNIRISQHLMLLASILGLAGKAYSIYALWNMHLGILHKRKAYCSFVVSGTLNMIAGLCILSAVLWNYYCITTLQGIAFSPSFQLPFKPDTQETGSAAVVASLGAVLKLLSGFFLSYQFSPGIQVHPKIIET